METGKEGGLGCKILRLQCNSEKVSFSPIIVRGILYWADIARFWSPHCVQREHGVVPYPQYTDCDWGMLANCTPHSSFLPGELRGASPWLLGLVLGKHLPCQHLWVFLYC